MLGRGSGRMAITVKLYTEYVLLGAIDNQLSLYDKRLSSSSEHTEQTASICVRMRQLNELREKLRAALNEK
jgi:hypothetical protein